MGILSRLPDETRDAGNWLTDDDDDGGRVTPAGIRVDWRVAATHPVVSRCIDLLASSVAGAPKDIIVRVGRRSFPEFTTPAWLAAPRGALDPTYTAEDYFMQVAISLLTDGNYFTHVFPNVLNPRVLTVLPPHNVTVKPGPLYEVRDAAGRVVNTYDAMSMLHGTWLRFPGELRGVGPLDSLRRGVGTAIAVEEYAGRFFGQGASLSFGVEVPGALTKEQKEELGKSLRKKYQGPGNSHAIGILTGGAKFVANLAPSPEQAQMLATQKDLREYLCTPFGVPPGMAGATGAGESYAASEVDDDQFKERAVLPLAQRIERQHNRLVQVPAGISDPNASAQFRFNLDNIARVNLLTRAQAYRELVTAGVMQPAEARDKEDMPPVDGADQLFMQGQMRPISQIIAPQPPPAGQS